MSLVEKNIIDYINEVDSLLPAPGGGSVAALVGALGVALGKMLGHFSIKKKKYNEASQKEKDKFIVSIEKLELCKDVLIRGIDDDALSYDSISKAYKAKDEKAIEQSLITANFISCEMVDAAILALKNLERLIPLGNKNLYSDLISGAILLNSCVEMISLNVFANAINIKDETIKNENIDKMNKSLQKSKSLKNKIIKQINN